MWVAPGGQGIALGLTFTASAILASAQASVTIAAQNALKDMKSDAFTRVCNSHRPDLMKHPKKPSYKAPL